MSRIGGELNEFVDIKMVRGMLNKFDQKHNIRDLKFHH